MSEQSIYDKSVVIRNETQEYANTRGRVADVLDDINFTKANKTDVDSAIQIILDELGITEAELYAYINSENELQDLEINKKVDKPLESVGNIKYILSNIDGVISWKPIEVTDNFIPTFDGDTFKNSALFQDESGNIGIGTITPENKLQVNGYIHAESYVYETTTENSIPNKTWTDGVDLFFTDENGITRKHLFTDSYPDLSPYALDSDLDAEIVNRALADTALDGKITTEKNRNDAQDLKIKENLLPVSATQAGIVDNTDLQELGGVDKLINGVRVGKGNASIENNLVISRNGLALNTTGKYNVAIGNGDGANEGVLQNNTTGRSNTSVGSDSMVANTTGNYNSAFGALALYRNIIGIYNTAIGSGTLRNNLESNNTAVGASALAYNTTGYYNVGVGSSSLQNNTTGYQNTSISSAFFKNTVGFENTGVGFNAGYFNISGSYNTYLGKAAGYDNTVGNYNVGIGMSALIVAGGGTGTPPPVNMNNNVFIGCSLRGADGMNSILAIDNKGATVTKAANALIYGGFSVSNRFVNISGKLSVTPTFMPTANNTYTKNIVANPDGTFGWEDKLNNSYSYEERKTGGTWVDGKPIYRKVIPFNLDTLGVMYDYEINHNLNISTYIDSKLISENFASTISSIPLSASIDTFGFTHNSVIYTELNKVIFEQIQVANIGLYHLILEYSKTTD